MIVSAAEASRRLGRTMKTLGRGRRSYYVLSKNGKKNLGGPYTRQGAVKRLRQVEYFKGAK